MLSTSQQEQQQSRLGDWLTKHEAISGSPQTANFAESGIAEDLYCACFDGLRYVCRELNRDNKLSARGAQKLQEDLGRLLLWGNGFRHGKLDKALNTSDSLKTDILTILQSIANLLIRTKAYGQGAVQLQSLLEKVRDVTSASLEGDNDLTEDDPSSDGSSEVEDHEVQYGTNPGREPWVTKFCREVSDNISCLMDFVFVLEQTLQSADHGFQRIRQLVLFEVSGPAHVYVTNIRDKYQHADLKLVQRSGEANWQRHVRIRSMLDQAEEEGPHAIPIDAKSVFTPFSKFHDSGLGTSLPAVSAYAVSNASHMSFASSLADGKESTCLRVPTTPAEVWSKKPFNCSICGEIQYNIKDRIAWKMHVFSDLQPYICTFPTCKDELLTFPSRKLWADHEFSMHRVTRTWVCPFCTEECSTIAAWQDHLLQSHETTFTGSLQQIAIKTAERKSEQSIKEQSCPFCLEHPATTRRTFVTHVGRHFEEIALATLPREATFDSGSESIISGAEESASRNQETPQNSSGQLDGHSSVARISTSNALAWLDPPPADAVNGSEYKPWLQLTPWEISMLRKRMKKSRAWIPSDETMARELKQLGRGIEAYCAAKSKAEVAGELFNKPVPPKLNGETGHIIDKLDDIAARMGHSLGNILDDEKETWKQFHSALVVEGFSSVVLQQHEDVLRAYVREIQVQQQQEHTLSMLGQFHSSFDTTGQVAPPGMKLRVTATLWEDEGALCFHVEAKGVRVGRREDNHMINGTKLLNVAGMTRGRRDGILMSEKVRHVVKDAPMDLKGVWIPFERALAFANSEKITELLYPLFVHNLGALLYRPSNAEASITTPSTQAFGASKPPRTPAPSGLRGSSRVRKPTRTAMGYDGAGDGGAGDGGAGDGGAGDDGAGEGGAAGDGAGDDD